VDGCFLCLGVFVVVVLCRVLGLFLDFLLFIFLRLVRVRCRSRRRVLFLCAYIMCNGEPNAPIL